MPCDALAFFVSDGTSLRPAFVDGRDSRGLRTLRIPLGEGLAVGVAERPVRLEDLEDDEDDDELLLEEEETGETPAAE